MLPIPEGYVLLRDAFNQVGRGVCGADWTGLEIATEGDKNDQSAVVRRMKAESAFRGRAYAGHIETVIWDTEAGELIPCPRQCWISEFVDIKWSSSTVELADRSAKATDCTTDPLVIGELEVERLAGFGEFQRSPIEGMMWHQPYRVLVRQASCGGRAMRPSDPSSTTTDDAEKTLRNHGDDTTVENVSNTPPSQDDAIVTRIREVIVEAKAKYTNNQHLSNEDIANAGRGMFE